MFNINLANKPGLQLDNKIDLDKNQSNVIFDDENKSKELNAGENLVGDVTQEFMLEDKFIKDSGWYTFLASCVNNWIEFETKKKNKKI